MDAIASYIEYALAIAFALMASGLVLFLGACVGMMLYALYKGATDETWR